MGQGLMATPFWRLEGPQGHLSSILPRGPHTGRRADRLSSENEIAKMSETD